MSTYCVIWIMQICVKLLARQTVLFFPRGTTNKLDKQKQNIVVVTPNFHDHIYIFECIDHLASCYKDILSLPSYINHRAPPHFLCKPN
jgi:hypothetical protein